METNRTIAPKVMERNKLKLHLFLLLLGIIIATFVTGCDSGDKGDQKGGTPPPASITFRNSKIDSSTKVFQVTNRSGSETLVMKLDFHDNKGHHGEHQFKVSPGDTYEIGVWETGLYFETGDYYSFQADGYALTIDGRIP